MRKPSWKEFYNTFFFPKKSSIQNQPKLDFTCSRCGRHHIDIDTHSLECKGKVN